MGVRSSYLEWDSDTNKGFLVRINISRLGNDCLLTPLTLSSDPNDSWSPASAVP